MRKTQYLIDVLKKDLLWFSEIYTKTYLKLIFFNNKTRPY